MLVILKLIRITKFKAIKSNALASLIIPLLIKATIKFVYEAFALTEDWVPNEVPWTCLNWTFFLTLTSFRVPYFWGVTNSWEAFALAIFGQLIIWRTLFIAFASTSLGIQNLIS